MAILLNVAFKFSDCICRCVSHDDCYWLRPDALHSSSSEVLWCFQPMEVFVDDETKLTLHGLQQYYCKLKDSEKNRKLFDLLDVLEFNQVSAWLDAHSSSHIYSLADASDQTRPCLLQSCCDSSLFPKKVVFYDVHLNALAFPPRLPCSCRLWFLSEVLEVVFLRVILCLSCRWWSSWSPFSAVWLFHSYWWSRTSPPLPSTEEWHRKRGVCARFDSLWLTHETRHSQEFVSPNIFKSWYFNNEHANVYFIKFVTYNIINLSNFSCSFDFCGLQCTVFIQLISWHWQIHLHCIYWITLLLF